MLCHNPEALKNLKRMTVRQASKMYDDCGRHSSAMASQLGLSRSSVENRLRFLGIRLRNVSEFIITRNWSKNDQSLTLAQKDLILGSLVGDACVHKQRNSIAIRFCHCNAQFGYLKHKSKIFNGRASKLYPVPVNNFGSERTAFTFTSTPTLQEFYDLCIVDGQKTMTKRWADRLTLNAVSYWYEDDGSLWISNPRTGCSVVHFHTQSMSVSECEILQLKLAELGLQTRIDRCGPSGCYPILASRFSDETRNFLGKLTCHHPCMQYKFKTALR